MNLSSLGVTEVGIFTDNKSLGRFIVIGREPEDRSSGSTKIRYETSKREETIFWDSSNPEVKFLGRGKIVPMQIEFPEG